MSSDVNLDFERAQRRGYPEAVYCEFKSPDQVRRIAEQIRERAGVDAAPVCTLFTRALPEHVEVIHAVLPDAHHDEAARLLAATTPPAPSAWAWWWPVPAPAIAVARSSADGRYLGRETRLLADIGVAGLHARSPGSTFFGTRLYRRGRRHGGAWPASCPAW